MSQHVIKRTGLAAVAVLALAGLAGAQSRPASGPAATAPTSATAGAPLGAATGSATASSGPSAQDKKVQAAIARAIAQLSSKDPAEQQEAQDLLWSIGPAAEPALREAARALGGAAGGGPAKAGIQAILGKFDRGLFPDTSPAAAHLIEQFQSAEEDEKRPVVLKMLKAGPDGLHAAIRLTVADPDAKFARAVREPILSELALLLREKPTVAEELLREAAASGSDVYCRHLAGLLLAQGRLAQEIKQLRQTAVFLEQHRQLAWMCRAAGDLDAAAAAAQAAKDPELTEKLLFEAGKWQDLWQIRKPKPLRPGAQSLAQQAQIARLAGDQRACEELLDRLEALAMGEEVDAWQAAAGMLMNDAFDRAIALGSLEQPEGWAFELLLGQRRYEEAFALLERHIASTSLKAGPQAQAVRLYAAMGELEQAVALAEKTLDRLSASSGQAQAAPVLAGLMRTEAAPKAMVLLEQMLSWPPKEKHDLLTRVQGRNVAAALDAQQFAEIITLMRWRDAQQQPVMQSVDSFCRLLAGKWTKEELSGFVDSTANIYSTKENQLALSAATAEMCMRYKQTELALVCIGRCEMPVRIQFLLDHQQWAEVLPLVSDQAATAGKPLDVFLAGWLSEKTADEATKEAAIKAGKEMMAKGLQACLGDEGRLAELMWALEKLPGARQQADMAASRLVGLGEPGSFRWCYGALRLGLSAAAKKDHATAAMRYEHYRLIYQEGSMVQPQGYLLHAYRIHSCRMQAALAEGKLDEATAAAKQALTALPEIDPAILIVRALDKAGAKAQADELFKGIFERQVAAADYFPKSAHTHNNVAWLAASCRRELDSALKHAQEALKLAPKNPQIIDTLAEATFQLGKKNQAIELMKQCIELDDKQPYYRKQLERFEAGKLDTPPPELEHAQENP